MNQTLNITATLFKSETPPKQFKPRRKCEGPGKTHYVTMYTKRQIDDNRGRDVPGKLLCNSCVEKEADRRIAEAKERVARKAIYARESEGYLVPGLYDARKRYGKTQAGLALAVGISAQHLSCIERQMAKTSKATLRRMSQVLKVPMANLLTNAKGRAA